MVNTLQDFILQAKPASYQKGFAEELQGVHDKETERLRAEIQRVEVEKVQMQQNNFNIIEKLNTFHMER